MTKKHLLILWICFCHFANAQQKDFVIPDSLSTKGYEYFSKNILYKERDSVKEKGYAKSWLAKAKLEKNYGQMALAYKALLYKSNKKSQLIYADSIVAAAKKTADIELIGSAYMTKGIIYYDRREQMNALDNYLIADEYLSKTNNQYLIYKLKYAIGLTKFYLGFYDEAIALFKECVNYFKQENNRAYLNSLHSLGLCYNCIGKYELSSQTNQLGLSAGKRYKNLEMQSYFIESEGVNQYFKHNYSDAIKKLTAALPQVRHNKDFANETVANFYIGKSYWSQNLEEKALPYLKKVDDAFQKQNYIRPDLREAYELLIGYYQQRNDKQKELYYVSTLLKVDKLIHKDYKYLSGKIYKEYNTKKLLQTQRDNEQFWTVVAFIIITIMTIIIAFFISRHYRNKRLFATLMNREPDTVKSLAIENGNKEMELDISPEVVTVILKNLEKFEYKKKYLDKDMTLGKMASILNTNPKYVSKIIARYRSKGSIEYVSDLKIDHIVALLKNESKYRNYTNKALGEEAGFGSTQKFTRAFNNRTGLSPTYFITALKNQ
ncbi:AraC family transcriptional regulator [Flavobacterium taihuense]|uniref:AraC family transcriptional regulator n=1 Tax=Flavobacterium taihuense TaxID=2857508 RepID=A0ABS6XWM2_9FLAO|nr:AraC family transcriptional regulator [Flavobacterium taihuense]MBW4361076.1 AraC family transcriptional regulator [Flavobacterium taihuense]